MTREVVVIENGKFDTAVVREVMAGEDVTVTATSADGEGALVSAAAGADALIALHATVSGGIMDRLGSLEVIAVPGIGVDQIDLVAADANGVVVVNAPRYAVEEVSTHAASLLLACVRELRRFDRDVRDGGWDWRVGRPIHRLRGRTLGLVAFGKIARRLAEKLRGFDLDTVAYDPYVDADEMAGYGVEPVGLEELLERSHLISVHAPLTAETEGMIDAAAFGAMREGVVVVNTGRGPVIETEALIEALDGGPVALAGMDVLEEEPPNDPRLFERENVLLSPHAAWYSEAARHDCIRSVAEDVRRVFVGEEPVGRVSPGDAWR